MKNLITYFIKYSVAVNVFIFALVVLGLVGILNMKSSFFPLVDSQLISINLVYPGASPAEIEEGVVLKIEDNIKGTVGVERVTSISRENSAVINVEVIKGKNIDVVLSDVKNAVDRVPSFPTGLEPPVIAKVENISPTISFSLSGKGVSLNALKQYARNIENDIRGIEGISQVVITGFPEEEIEISVRENDLLAYDLTFTEVANAVRNANILITGGNIKTTQEDYLIRASNRSYYGEDLQNLIVRSQSNGTIIRLKDVAEVKDTWSEIPDRLYYNSDLAIDITVSNTNSEDLLSTATKIKNYIYKYNQKQQNVQLNVTSDRSTTLIGRTKLLVNNGIFGILLVIFFLALFLNLRLAIWVAFGIPVAFFGMFVLAGQFNVTINVLSLFGMIIVIGILVDDGIVIGENIYHHYYDLGKSKIKAAIDGTMEVIPAIVSAVLTTLIAFSTFFFVDGRIGIFFGEVSTIVILTLTVSLIEALIILPAHIVHSKVLERKKFENGEEIKKNKFDTFFNKINEYADNGLIKVREKFYMPILKFSLKNKIFAISIPVALLIFSFSAIGGGIVKTSFFPSIASDQIQISLKMPQGTNEKITDSIISMIERKALIVGEEYTKKQEGNIPVVENIIKRIGPGSANGSLTVNLLPGEARDFSSPEITNSITDAVGKIYGVESLVFGSGGNFGGSPVAVSLLGNNIQELKAAKDELKQELLNNSRLKDVVDNDPAGIKEIKIKLKENAYLLGLNLQSVMTQVRDGFFGFQAQRFQRAQDEIKVWVRYDKKDRSSIKNLDEMRIIAPNGSRIPFSEIANYSIERGDIAINHLEGKREIQVTADLKNKTDTATEILEDIKLRIMPKIISKYPSVSPLYEGQNREANKTTSSVAIVGPIILLLIYIVIAFTFRSYSQPILLILLIPFSMIGVVWGHYFHSFPIGILSWLGIIALIGIMVNDGLVLIGKMNSSLKEGMNFDDALIKAGQSRFRAIFLTSLTTIAGLGPLIFEKSRQAQFLIPMAISIAYGIAIATALTLLILPLLLSVSNSIKVGIKWLKTGDNITKEEVERAVMELEFEHEDELENAQNNKIG
ncbi:MAG: efflux RND transporter permease subunit [Flavobacteriia bacterium]|nr:efflux RND transporter permease subunit [Flavobacteriia bacterium]OIP46366.1 MAG: RND transporter [Flavobacteriaceae bacterium CG2_30_31_66]PIV95732.1 MAG: RND transporter [Flavobacteriaceae bacterium CG17_big_fil_post_rev_8_21_14_2_50_31_13]PIY15631.1 MAG: RND transporter [Flavobacteriaceae bacterium CG_4_10_14_3_um_filter_31_253]PIZ09302.1 MAG: RND transporter [Flavobacteriaceae bacterium CG_4_10_14_0_8_um_filter_31_99]PJC09229.1 MAG: RND transporter [Flavobacteriaceae bacterium CG_4_9_14